MRNDLPTEGVDQRLGGPDESGRLRTYWLRWARSRIKPPMLCLEVQARLDSHVAPHPNFRDSHASVGQPAYRDLVQPCSSV